MRTKSERGDAVETGRRRWLGGFIRETKAGRDVYVIEKRIRGALFKVSTRRHTEDGAMRELRKFEADPAAYDPAGVARLAMTPELVIEYCDWMEAPPPHGRGNTHEWVLQSGRFLRDWLAVLGGVDLRHVKLTEHIKPNLKTWRSAHPSRVVALKGFFTWLRKEKNLLKHHEDPMPDMRIPQRHAAKETATGARDVPFERVQAVYEAVRADMHDVLQVLIGTGWHVSEVHRFARNGEIRKDPTGKHLATLVTFHKRKEWAVTGLQHQEHLDAARRLREQGYTWSPSTFTRLMRRANKVVGVPVGERPVKLGDMRHNVSTWAIEAGDTMENTAKALNHTSEAMLRRHYVRHAVPRGTVKTRVLKSAHVEPSPSEVE